MHESQGKRGEKQPDARMAILKNSQQLKNKQKLNLLSLHKLEKLLQSKMEGIKML
jgi:hypothetical protein